MTTRTLFWEDVSNVENQRLGQFFVNRFNPSTNELLSVDCENMFYETDVEKVTKAINTLFDRWGS